MSLTKKIWDGLWTGTAASVFENLLRIPRMMVMTRILGPEFYGLLGLFGVFREVVGKFIQLGTGDAVIQFLATAKVSQNTKSMGDTMGAAALVRLITICVSLVAFLIYEQDLVVWVKRYPATLHVRPNEMIWLFRVLMVGIVIQALEGPLGNALQGFQAWKSLLVVRIIGAMASTGLPIAAALMGFHLLGIVVAQQLAFGVIALVITYYYWSQVKPHLTRPGVKQILAQLKPVLLFGLPLIFSQFFRLIYTYTDQLMLAGMGKIAAELSYYEVARNAAAMLIFVPALLRSVMFPASAEFYAQKDKTRLQALFTFMVKHLFWFLLPLGACMAVLSPLAIEIIAGEQYLPASKALAWLSLFVVMQSFGVPFFTCLVGSLCRTKDQLYISIAGGGLNVLLNYLWIPTHGFMGAVYATGAGHLLSFSLAYFFLSSHMKLNFPLRSMFISISLTATASGILYLAMQCNFFLVTIVVPVLVCLYFLGLVRFGAFDNQDLGYLMKLFSPINRHFNCTEDFLKKYARNVRKEDKL
jgi:O-antigen/teichoic acid export membrane protein